jgi:DNA polymerase-3 subunit delta
MPSPIKSDELFAAWAKGQFKSVYLFTGAEDFLIEEALLRLTAQRLPEGRQDTNLDRLDAEKASVDDILQAAQTMPFAGPFRFVEVANTAKLSADEQKQIAAALPKLPPTTQLVFIWGKEWRRDDSNRPLVEAVMTSGSAVIFWPLFPDQAQRWLMNRVKLYKKSLDPDAAAWLVKESGEGLRRLDQELQKAAVYVGGRPDITREDLEESSGYQKAQSPYEWLAAVRQKKYEPSMRMLRQLLEDDEEPLKLLAMATGSLRDWIVIKESGQAPKFYGRGARDEGQLLQDLERRSAAELVEGLSCCVEAHQTIKTGKETPEMALTLLTLRLCGLQPLDTAR